MNKSVLISIRPKWCELIASGKKTVEVRKTRPKIETPFRCYIYCTKDPILCFWTGPRYSYCDDHSHNQFDRFGNGKVVGEFVCNEIDLYGVCGTDRWNMGYRRVDKRLYVWPIDYGDICLSKTEFSDYGGGKNLYGWHISDLKIYDEPRELTEFYRTGDAHTIYCDGCLYHETPGDIEPCASCDTGRIYLTRPPQSWCYVEELR